MGTIKLDSGKIEQSIGLLHKQVNQEVLDRVKALAVVLKDSGDDNEQVKEMLEVAGKFQSQYNEFIDSVDGFVKDAEQVFDLSEYMAKRATVGDISKRDLSFQNNKIDSGPVMQ
jgi:hypothetical protein